MIRLRVMVIVPLSIRKNIYKQKKPGLSLCILCQTQSIGTIYAGLPDHPKRDTILPCRENGACISFDWSMRQTQESDTLRLVLVGVSLFFFFWFVSYFKCCSSTTTISVSVSGSYSAMNCLALVRKSIPLTLAKYFTKSFAPMRIQSFLMRRAKS